MVSITPRAILLVYKDRACQSTERCTYVIILDALVVDEGSQLVVLAYMHFRRRFQDVEEQKNLSVSAFPIHLMFLGKQRSSLWAY